MVTEGTADAGPYLDPGRTLAKLDGVADQVQGLLGLPAAGAAEPYRGVGSLGAVQLAYRTADDLEVSRPVQWPAQSLDTRLRVSPAAAGTR